MKRAWLLARRDIIARLRNGRLLFMALLFPLGVLAFIATSSLFGFFMTWTAIPSPRIAVLQDGSPQAEAFAKLVGNWSNLTLLEVLDEGQTPDARARLDEDLLRGRIDAWIALEPTAEGPPRIGVHSQVPLMHRELEQLQRTHLAVSVPEGDGPESSLEQRIWGQSGLENHLIAPTPTATTELHALKKNSMTAALVQMLLTGIGNFTLLATLLLVASHTHQARENQPSALHVCVRPLERWGGFLIGLISLTVISVSLAGAGMLLLIQATGLGDGGEGVTALAGFVTEHSTEVVAIAPWLILCHATGLLVFMSAVAIATRPGRAMGGAGVGMMLVVALAIIVPNLSDPLRHAASFLPAVGLHAALMQTVSGAPAVELWASVILAIVLPMGAAVGMLLRMERPLKR